MRLFWYRLRPVSWPVLATVSVLWLLVIDLAGPRLGPVVIVYATRAAGALVGIQAAFLVSSEVDPPHPLLQGAPVPYWRTAALRLVLWAVLMASVLVLVVSHIGAGPVGRGAILRFWPPIQPECSAPCRDRSRCLCPGDRSRLLPRHGPREPSRSINRTRSACCGSSRVLRAIKPCSLVLLVGTGNRGRNGCLTAVVAIRSGAPACLGFSSPECIWTALVLEPTTSVTNSPVVHW